MVFAGRAPGRACPVTRPACSVCRGTDIALIDDRCSRCQDPDAARVPSVERLVALLARAAGLASRLAARESAVIEGRATGQQRPQLAELAQRIGVDVERSAQELRRLQDAG